MKALRRFCAVLIGLVFFLAGLVKVMDPVGAGLVVQAYFRFMHLGFLDGVAGAVGAALALFETLLGAALLSGVWRKAVAVATGITLGAFTVLTMVLWIANPAMDCGCFGEAVHLTHLQSLLKNLVLCVLWTGAFVPLRGFPPVRKVKYVTFSITALAVCAFAVHSMLDIPVVDFTDYKPGAELESDEEYANVTEPGVSLSFTDPEGEYADGMALDSLVTVISVYDPGSVDRKWWESVAGFADASAASGFVPLVLIASVPEAMQDALTAVDGLDGRVYYADRKELMTLNRSNGGVTFISGGQIIRKWSARQRPSSSDLAGLAETDAVETLSDTVDASAMASGISLLGALALLLLF